MNEMTTYEPEPEHEPDTTELTLRAEAAREQLMGSLARLDERVRTTVHQATDAGVAGGLCVAALFTCWVTLSAMRPRRPELPELQRKRPSFLSLVLRAGVVAAGVVATGLLVTAAERHVRASSARLT
jgi:hypothetical protein